MALLFFIKFFILLEFKSSSISSEVIPLYFSSTNPAIYPAPTTGINEVMGAPKNAAITDGNLPLAIIAPRADKPPFISIQSIVSFFRASGSDAIAQNP